MKIKVLKDCRILNRLLKHTDGKFVEVGEEVATEAIACGYAEPEPKKKVAPVVNKAIRSAPKNKAK